MSVDWRTGAACRIFRNVTLNTMTQCGASVRGFRRPLAARTIKTRFSGRKVNEAGHVCPSSVFENRLGARSLYHLASLGNCSEASWIFTQRTVVNVSRRVRLTSSAAWPRNPPTAFLREILLAVGNFSGSRRIEREKYLLRYYCFRCMIRRYVVWYRIAN